MSSSESRDNKSWILGKKQTCSEGQGFHFGCRKVFPRKELICFTLVHWSLDPEPTLSFRNRLIVRSCEGWFQRKKKKRRNQCDIITVDLFRLSLGITNAITQVRNMRERMRDGVDKQGGRGWLGSDSNQVDLDLITRSFIKQYSGHGEHVQMQYVFLSIHLAQGLRFRFVAGEGNYRHDTLNHYYAEATKTGIPAV